MNTKNFLSTLSAAVDLAAVQKLTAGDGESGDLFGNSVALSADSGTALIGALYDDNAAGSAYVFSRAADGTWSQQAKLTAADGGAGHLFGHSVSLSGDGGTALIGAGYHDGKGEHAGAAYVFTRAADAKRCADAKQVSHRRSFRQRAIKRTSSTGTVAGNRMVSAAKLNGTSIRARGGMCE